MITYILTSRIGTTNYLQKLNVQNLIQV